METYGDVFLLRIEAHADVVPQLSGRWDLLGSDAVFDESDLSVIVILDDGTGCQYRLSIVLATRGCSTHWKQPSIAYASVSRIVRQRVTKVLEPFETLASLHVQKSQRGQQMRVIGRKPGGSNIRCIGN